MKKTYQLLAIFLCLATPSFSSGDGKFSESDLDTRFCDRMYYPIAKCIYEIPAIDSAPLRAYAAQHPESNQIIQSICAKIESVKELNTSFLEKLRTFRPSEMDIFQEEIFDIRIKKDCIIDYDIAIPNSDIGNEPLGLYVIIALKFHRVSEDLNPRTLINFPVTNPSIARAREDVCTSMSSLKKQCASLMEELGRFKDGTFVDTAKESSSSSIMPNAPKPNL
jgi:hypothetical protein